MANGAKPQAGPAVSASSISESGVAGRMRGHCTCEFLGIFGREVGPYARGRIENQVPRCLLSGRVSRESFDVPKLAASRKQRNHEIRAQSLLFRLPAVMGRGTGRRQKLPPVVHAPLWGLKPLSRGYVFIESKKSPFVFVCLSLSMRNSIASVVPIGARMRRRTKIFCRS